MTAPTLSTTVVPPPESPEPIQAPLREERRSTGGRRASDRWALGASALAALALTGLLFQRIAPFSGAVGFTVCLWLCWLGLYALVLRDEGGLAVRDRLASFTVHSIAGLLLGILVWIAWYVTQKGWDALWFHPNFFSQDLSEAGPSDPLDRGGALHAMVGTLTQITISLAITIPLGLSCAIFLNEVPGRFARTVRTLVEAMTALPSILAGLFVYAVLVITFEFPRSGFAAAVALSVMMLPILIRASDVVLRLVPGSLKEASYALGAGRWRTVWTVTLPSARSGLATAVILAAARGIGETSPVLLCSGYTKNLNLDPFSGAQASLPLMAFTLIKLPSDLHKARAFGAAAVLLVLVVVLFGVARLVGGRGPGELSARQQRRRALRSVEDFRRMHPAVAQPPGKEPVLRGALVRTTTLLAALAVAAGSLLLGTAPRAAAEDYRRISGAGSTWSSNAMDSWVSNVRQYGMTIDFDAQGSSYGRNQFKNGATDFAVTEIPYGLNDGGQFDAPPPWPSAYLPIVAGGTSFMYNLKINGTRVTNLRLSGESIAKIFTGKITRWNDPALQADNPGLKMPDIPVRPVVRSDGSGTTAQLTTWMSRKQQAIWDDYCVRSPRHAPCGMTSFYPLLSGSTWQSLGTSVAVANAVANDANVGAITYVEYSYALNSRFPVAKMLNSAGYYVEPNGKNVSVALKQVRINSDLTQQLDGVYDSPDKSAYPLSSYSYMAVHTSEVGTFSKEKGHTLAAFGYYFLCEGQKQADGLGYSPLTPNLVQSAFEQLAKVPGSEGRAFDAGHCTNPTFGPNGSNPYADSADPPKDCDRKGAGSQCGTGTGGAKQETPVTAGGSGGAGGAGSGGGAGGTGGTGGAGATGGAGGAGTGGTGGTGGDGAAGGSAGGGDPALTGGGSGGTGGGGQQYSGDAVQLAAGGGSGLRYALMAIAGALLGALIVLPPVIAGRSARAAYAAGDNAQGWHPPVPGQRPPGPAGPVMPWGGPPVPWGGPPVPWGGPAVPWGGGPVAGPAPQGGPVPGTVPVADGVAGESVAEGER
ncbi:phosphate ABC transporter permease PstA [Kitasatospora cinereorecta]|uniref:Phosphate transport system permease protein PstA n=1 Tax=Kitasatospora cinereorecta TaxID=285560 RepID=A0ABW0VM96_9ACTN